jgi:hypothetical protein
MHAQDGTQSTIEEELKDFNAGVQPTGKRGLGQVPDSDVERASTTGSVGSAQDGVKRIEAVSSTWTKWGLIFAYIGYVPSRAGDLIQCFC